MINTIQPDIQQDGMTLYKGDSLKILPQLPAGAADALVTDNPYSSGGLFLSSRQQKTSSKYQGTGFKDLYPEFAGDNRDQWSQMMWMVSWLIECNRILTLGAPVMLFTDWRQINITSTALQMAGFTWRGIVPWNKTASSRPQKGQFRAQCEYVVWGSKDQMLNKNGPALPGFFSVNDDDAPEYDWCQSVPESITCSPQKGGKHHIAGKPLELMQQLIEIVQPGKTILDAFMGSGSTGLACKDRNPFIGIELTPCNFMKSCQRLGLMPDAANDDKEAQVCNI